MKRSAPGTPQALSNKETAIQALALRKTGATYEQIAAHLGYSNRQSANRAVLRLLAAHEAENVADLRTLENMRLDDLLFAVYKAAKSGDLGAIDRALRIMERRAKLLGLDAPVKQEISGTDGAPLSITIDK